MLITQKYNSAGDIDTEFIPSLEELLSETTPSFETIKAHEEQAPENQTFAYYLFFGQKTNAPIGFAQVVISKDKELKQNPLKKLFQRKDTIEDNKFEKSVSWFIPGAHKEGIVFAPEYSKYAKDKTLEIFKEYDERKDIYAQNLRFSDAFETILPNQDQFTHKDEIIIDALIKNKASYEDFYLSLKQSTQKQIKNAWKFVARDLAYQMGMYKNLKDVFTYKERGAEQYRQLKDHSLFKKYNPEHLNLTFVTLETAHEVKSIMLFIDGHGINCFYEFLNLSEDIPEIVPHQLAIVQFFEHERCDRLHYLGEITNRNFFLDLGYTYRKQQLLKMTKNPKQ